MIFLLPALAPWNWVPSCCINPTGLYCSVSLSRCGQASLHCQSFMCLALPNAVYMNLPLFLVPSAYSFSLPLFHSRPAGLKSATSASYLQFLCPSFACVPLFAVPPAFLLLHVLPLNPITFNLTFPGALEFCPKTGNPQSGILPAMAPCFPLLHFLPYASDHLISGSSNRPGTGLVYYLTRADVCTPRLQTNNKAQS